MKAIHTPSIGWHYWTAITLASIFGTNLGDYYAHESGLGIGGGLVLLAVIFGVVKLIEQTDKIAHYYYYWCAIIIIRTGATNIADFLAGRNGMHLDRTLLSLILALAMSCLVWSSYASARAAARNRDDDVAGKAGSPKVNGTFWLTMLVAGTFGTVFGDLCSHALGGGSAALILAAMLAVVLYAGRGGVLATMAYYWFAIAIVRSAGTAIGDWIAENQQLHIGLSVSTMCTGLLFAMAVLLWDAQARAGQRADTAV
ncbi:hypothetical protein FO488_03700 [Geobacter sp. FeAm09]|uniref:hypothetical protein n=1 Tax=Geobacter sp. FeAm09 TaxID=2597769 RepID=UPI0011F04E7D|nr:hypothetical protein [Geobacter sp. FeAm09]QEM67344.1 hypothetical protein FO488_03700 [Geobacter sp. FeAm09]